MNRLKIALTKGRLEKSAIELFEKAGIDCSPLREDTRRLIHTLPTEPLDILLVKAQDVITYVEIWSMDWDRGKDTILEHGKPSLKSLI